MSRIVQDAHTCFGKPRLEGTRMPTIALWHCHEEGVSIEEMIGPDYWPHLTREQVAAALEFERSIREPCGKVRDRGAYKLKNGRRLAPSDGVVWTQEKADAVVRDVTTRLEAKGRLNKKAPPARAGQRRDGGKLTAIYPTMLSTFISRLQEIMERHGDIPVVAYAPEDGRTSRVSADILEHYYDGGWLDPAEDTPYHCRHWMKSRTTKANNIAVLIRADEPELAFAEDPPEHRDTIDGEPVPDCEDH